MGDGIETTIIPTNVQADNITTSQISGVLSVKDGGVGITQAGSDLLAALMRNFGDGSDGSLNITSGTTTTASPYGLFSDITLANGATWTFSGSPNYTVFCQGDMTINGALTLPAYTRLGKLTDAANGSVGQGARVGGGAGATGLTSAEIFRLMFCPFNGSTGGAGAAGSGGTTYTGDGGGGGASLGNGGVGGLGGFGSGGGGAAGAGGAGGESRAGITFIVGGAINFGATAVFTGKGVVGAQGGGAVASGGGGGGGGGALAAMFCKGDMTLATGASLDFSGGIGGQGGNGTWGGAGGGGGGGGGLLGLTLGTLTDDATESAAGGAGGAVGTNSTGYNNAPSAGTAGTAGALYIAAV